MKILFMTQNEADFRMKWLDELARYAEVKVFHIDEYVATYAKYKPVRAQVRDISKKVLSKKIYNLKEFRKEKYDLLILDGYGFWAQQLLILYLKRKKMPYALSLDGVNLHYSESKIRFLIKSYFISGAIAYLSTSIYTDEYIRCYTEKKAVIYRHLFSSVCKKQIVKKLSGEEKKEIRNNLGIDNKFTVIAVGRFIRRKGFDILLEAVKHVMADIQVLIIGEGNKDIYNENINGLNRDHVRFISFCDADLLGEYYKASDVFVLPTRQDVWGLVIGEAMAYGLPVITTDMCLAGITMIQDSINGYIVKAEDVYGLAEKIDFLFLNADVRYKMSCNNIEVIKQYSIEESTRQDIRNFENICKDLTGKSAV